MGPIENKTVLVRVYDLSLTVLTVSRPSLAWDIVGPCMHRLGVGETTEQHLNQWWPSPLTHMWPQTVLDIQIKICAEYRDMLPRPRLVCQEPGLRPIGRSPGVPDKSSRGLGSISRYFAQILIWFIAYNFLFFLFLCGLGWELRHLSHSLVKMTDKVDEICINGKFSALEPSEWRDFSIPVSNFTVFQPII